MEAKIFWFILMFEEALETTFRLTYTTNNDHKAQYYAARR